MMIYALVILISLFACGMGFLMEVTVCNITHIKNGRKPEAGAAIFPAIPTMQILAVLLAWGLNHVYPYMGFYAVAALFVYYCISWTPAFLKANRELKKLEQTGASEQAAGELFHDPPAGHEKPQR